MSRPMFDRGTLCFLPQVTTPGKNILREGKQSSCFLRVWCQPRQFSKSRFAVGSLRDDAGSFTKFSCRSIATSQPQCPARGRKERNTKTERASTVLFRSGHDGDTSLTV